MTQKNIMEKEKSQMIEEDSQESEQPEIHESSSDSSSTSEYSDIEKESEEEDNNSSYQEANGDRGSSIKPASETKLKIKKMKSPLAPKGGFALKVNSQASLQNKAKFKLKLEKTEE